MSRDEFVMKFSWRVKDLNLRRLSRGIYSPKLRGANVHCESIDRPLGLVDKPRRGLAANSRRRESHLENLLELESHSEPAPVKLFY